MSSVILTGTLIYFGLGFLALIFVSVFFKHDKALAQTMVILTTICTWLMWLVVYMHQMNPLIIPEIKETFLEDL